MLKRFWMVLRIIKFLRIISRCTGSIKGKYHVIVALRFWLCYFSHTEELFGIKFKANVSSFSQKINSFVYRKIINDPKEWQLWTHNGYIHFIKSLNLVLNEAFKYVLTRVLLCMLVSLYNIFGTFIWHDKCTISEIHTDVWIALYQLKVNVNLDGFYISAW